jgi:branched-chain amino acid transport system permease protein
MVAAPASSIPPAVPASLRPSLASVLRETGLTALVAFGLFLPLIGLETVQNIRNELVLDTRFVLLGAMVAIIAGLRFVQIAFLAPWLAGGGLDLTIPPDVRALIARWGKPAVLAFVVIYPIAAFVIAGPSAGKWIDNFGVQILIYVLLGWGLNIVVGLAGLLDLGYVAFYAIGAYTVALLGKSFGLSFWMLLPLAGVLAAFWGVILGFPVLRLRGDYLAVVTLAFGEIIRLVLVNWVPVTGGYAGISGTPRPTLFGIPFTNGPEGFAARLHIEFSPLHRLLFLYFILLAAVLITAVVIHQLRRMPIGRAWEALREDEIACRSLGINTTTSKLTAFAIGAFFGGLAGAFFTARQGFISPESVNFGESALILAIVVLGGMGSQVGVAIAAVVIIGGTEALRELDFLKQIFGAGFNPAQYRMLLFGFAMVLIIVWKPRGLIGTRDPTVVLKERKAISAALVREGHG